MLRLRGDLVVVISLLLVAHGLPARRGGRVKRQAQAPRTCQAGQYFDIVNQVCYPVPDNCLPGAVRDLVLGCRCPFANQVYNGRIGVCQLRTSNQQNSCGVGQYFDSINNVCVNTNNNQQNTCPAGQFFDTVNNACYPVPQWCPFGTATDSVRGCQCPDFAPVYNAVNRRCQSPTNNNQQNSCGTGQFFDTINNACYSVPQWCPFGAATDSVRGCQCPGQGQAYNALTGSCQNNQQNSCGVGQYFDTTDNVCYPLPRWCPYGFATDSPGCRCAPGQVYNRAAAECQDANNQQNSCGVGRYFDTTNRLCYVLPVFCPVGASIDAVLGCRCPSGQTYNGANGQCQNTINNQQNNACGVGQYFDTINSVCYVLPVFCPAGAFNDALLGCRCPSGQTYNGANGQCQDGSNQGGSQCARGQYFDTANSACYVLPTVCPQGSQFDQVLGCRCNVPGEMYNGVTRACQNGQARSCQNGQYFDTVNNACYNMPVSCPFNSQRDNTVGCRCFSANQVYNGLTRQCQNKDQSMSCNFGQYYDRINRRCDLLPTSCPFGSQRDNTFGCRCQGVNQVYNGLTRQCQQENNNQPGNCQAEQYYDEINRACYFRPTACPFGSQLDYTVGCRCQTNGQTYNGLTRQCENSNQMRNCAAGLYFDTINNMCFPIPRNCPVNSQPDYSVGCRCQAIDQTYNGATRQCDRVPLDCPSGSQPDATVGCRCLTAGQSYNRVTRQCEDANQMRNCASGLYFDTINSICYPIPWSCPANSQTDYYVGCRCQAFDQIYNGVTGQCENPNQPSTDCPFGQYFDTINNICYNVPRTCPFESQRDITVGCRCYGSLIYNGATGRCQDFSQQRTCPSGQFFDTINSMCYNIPTTCPFGSQRDNTVGCRCQTAGQTFNGATRLCQDSNQPRDCQAGQYFDTINNACYGLPRTCPFGSQPDGTVGCRCQMPGLSYNGVTGQCQGFSQQNDCPFGQYFDVINSVCYNLLSVCPAGTTPDTTVGCRCNNGLTYNGATGQCQNFNTQARCVSGQYFDTINNFCYALPSNCPFGTTPDNTVGCRCQATGQTYNGVTRQCENSNQQGTCANGQYFDTMNNVCYNLPTSCPPGTTPDFTLGCRCPFGQTYNGAAGECQNNNRGSNCVNGQYFDTTNNACYNLPITCPFGSEPDATVGCRCQTAGQVYNGLTQQCQPENNNGGNNCANGQYFDTTNKACYNLPRTCPFGSQYDATVGCRCQTAGQVYNGATQQCQASSDTRPCPTGQFYDTINRGCYNNPTFCPLTATLDVTLGCRCPADQFYNGVSGLCQSRTTTCATGQFFDRINNRCTPLPLSSQCPAGARYDQNVGCSCPSGLLYNGLTRTCQTAPCPENSVSRDGLCQCSQSNQAYDAQRNTCVQRYPCPSNAVQNEILGCICSNQQFIYDNMSNQCVVPRLDSNTGRM